LTSWYCFIIGVRSSIALIPNLQVNRENTGGIAACCNDLIKCEAEDPFQIEIPG
jgi:hypothetical protein